MTKGFFVTKSNLNPEEKLEIESSESDDKT